MAPPEPRKAPLGLRDCHCGKPGLRPVTSVKGDLLRRITPNDIAAGRHLVPEQQPIPSQLASGETGLNLNALGLGDALLGLTAVGAYRREHPTAKIVYRINPGIIPWIRHFDGGYDRLAGHTGEHDPVDPADLQINTGYEEEVATLSAVARFDRYCRNIGVTGPVLPQLRNADQLRSLKADYAGCVVIAPFSAWRCREYPLQSWLTLEKLLAEEGYRVVLVCNQDARAEPFQCEKVLSQSPETVISILLNAVALVGNDSGLAHLSGIMGKPTILLSGQTSGPKIFGVYPRMIYLGGKLACSACYWQPSAGYNHEECQTRCAALGAIPPQDIVAEVQKLTPGKTLLSGAKLDALVRLVKETADLPGTMAELGVYRGGSARVIAEACPAKSLHLFDTFSGIPEDDQDGAHKRGDFASSMESVRSYLDGLKVVFHPGVFPATANGLGHMRFSFVHLDGDTYQTTKDALAYFWPRMVPGGICCLDDYRWEKCPGVERAIREAGLDKYLEQTAEYQCAIRKPRPAPNLPKYLDDLLDRVCKPWEDSVKQPTPGYGTISVI